MKNARKVIIFYEQSMNIVLNMFLNYEQSKSY